MSFKPKQQNTQDPDAPQIDWTAVSKQVKGGNRPARISLIVDLGNQEREEFQEEYKAKDDKHIKALKAGGYLSEEDGKQMINIPQKPQDQVAVFVDLTSDVVDYGGDIGKQPFRMIVNKSFKGDVAGIGFAGTYSFDNKGNVLKDKGFTFHSNSVLTKLAKATKQEQIVSGQGNDNMDVTQLLGHALMVTVDKTETDDKVYLNYKGCSEVPMIPSDPTDPDSDEVLMNVKPLANEAIIITFDNVTPELKKWIRGDVAKKIKKATNYKGSKMQEVLEAKSQSDEAAEPQAFEPEDDNSALDFDDSSDPF
jgi:hypothetical protein